MELWINQGIIIMVCITLWCHKLKTVATQLPAIQIWSRAMVDKCSFCTERCSTAIVQDDLVLAKTDYKRWTCAPIRAFLRRKPFFFWQIPRVKFAISSHSTWRKSCLFSVLVSYFFLKNHSDRARRVVHSSPCCTFHASLCTIQSKIILLCRSSLLVVSYLLWRWCHCFSLVIHNYYIILTDHSSLL